MECREGVKTLVSTQNDRIGLVGIETQAKLVQSHERTEDKQVFHHVFLVYSTLLLVQDFQFNGI